MVANSGTILDAALTAIEDNKVNFNAAKRQLFNLSENGAASASGGSLTAVSWHPTHDSAFFTSTYGLNEPVLITNDVFVSPGYTVYKKSLAIIGERRSPNDVRSRYMVMGGNPMRNAQTGSEVNDQMHQFLQNSFAWLTGRNDLHTTAWNVVIAQMDDSFYFPDDPAVRSWLDQKFGGKAAYNAKDACDGPQLPGCIATSTDLLIVSQVMNAGEDPQAIAAAIRAAMDRGIPVLYLHHDGDKKPLGEALFPLFDVAYETDAYWYKLRLTDYDGSQTYNTPPLDIQSIQTMLTHFKNQSFPFDLKDCDTSSCSNLAGFQTAFQEGASRALAMINFFDDGKVDIFAENDAHHLRFQKLLVLLADHYRQGAVFPMDKTATNRETFLKSYFADHVVYNFRTINPVQSNMGNFSRSNFSHITPINKTIALTSKKYFRAAGVYALPGQTFKVTRLDSSPVATSLFINTLRSGATHQFETNGYKRPKYLKSKSFSVKKDETVALTSPYGGPIQIGFDANDLAVEFRFENVGEHPFWDGPEDDQSFNQKLAAGGYDWAEIATPNFEVHSTLLKMRETLTNANWNTPFKLSEGINRYPRNFLNVLAGFRGPGIDVVPEIHNFATQKGWQIDEADYVQHMNADQANCGSGCSGNPYDAYWEFSPTGHGDLHEYGHNVEKGRFRFVGWDGHASTNPYSYYSKTQFFKDTGGDPDCQNLPFKTMFNTLQTAAKETDPFTYMQNAKLTDWSNGVGIYIQMMMSAQANGVLTDGWHLLARLHLLDREFERAKKDETTWLAKRDSLGFGGYSLDAAKAINNNDWLVIAISFVSGLDYRDYLTMWGLPFSSGAATQAGSFSYPVVPRKYYVSDGTDYCKGLDKSSVNIDGTSIWPQ